MGSTDLTALQEFARSDPQGFQALMEKVAKKVVHPHAAQKQVLDSDARFRVMNAGRRTGKTVLAAKITMDKTRKPDQMIWWVAPTYKVVKRGYREVLRQLPDGVLTHEPPPDTNFDSGRSVILRFKNGSRIEFYSAERPEGMLGEGVDFAVLDEAAIMPARIWEQVVSPTLMDHQGGALMISTPRGRNWFYNAWTRGQDPERPAWASWTFPTSSNPHIDQSEIDELEASLPRVTFQQEVLAQFIADGSSVFILDERVKQDRQIRDDGFVQGVKPEGHVVLGIDLAKTVDFTVLYGARAKDRRNCYFERFNGIAWKEQRRRIRRAVARCLAAGATGVTLVMDSTGVGDPIVEQMEDDGYDVVGINFTSHKANMVRQLANDLEMGRAWVLKDGEMHEFESYAMSFTPSGKISYGAPAGQHDDVVSAKLLQHHGLVNEGVPGAVMLDGSAIERDGDMDPDDDEPDVDTDDFSDLVDDYKEEMVTAEELWMRRPTVAELLSRDELWGS